MKSKENNKPINLTRTVSTPELPQDKGWKPVVNGDHITHTMPFGGQVPQMINVNPPKEEK